MMPRFFSVLMLVPLLIAGAAAAETFPKGDVFSPLVADPLEPRNFISVLRLDADSTETTLGSVGLGSNFGLRRWPGLQPGDGWQLGIFAAFANVKT